MRNRVKVQAIDYANKDLFIGVDVHKRRWSIAVVCEERNWKYFSINDPSPQKLERSLKKFFPGGKYHLAYEAGFSGYGLYDYFAERGIDIVVTPPNRVLRDSSRVKTDRLDAWKLARQLRQGLLKEVKVPDPQIRQWRWLFTLWDGLKKERQMVIRRIGSMLEYFNHPLQHQRWSARLVRQMEQLQFSEPYLTEALRSNLAHYHSLTTQWRSIKRQIMNLGKEPRLKEAVDNISAIYGISRFSAIRCVYCCLIAKIDSQAEQAWLII